MNDDLTGVMRSATENLTPNVGKLTAGGIERGVRRRRNRRIGQVVGAAASVTAVFGAVAAVGAPNHGGSASVSAASGTTPAVAAQTTAAAPGTTAGTQASSPAVPGTNDSTAPVSGDDMVKWMEQALTSYQFTGEKVLYKAGTNELAGPYATLRIGYATGAGSVSLSIARSPWSAQHIGGKVPYVTISTLPDGSHMMMFDGPEWPAGNGDPSAKRIEASWYRNDGTLVDLQVLNEVEEKGATTATGLGLTTDEAAKVVQSPVWDKAIASVLAEPAPKIPTLTNGAKGSGAGGAGGGTDTVVTKDTGRGAPTSPAAPAGQ